MADRKDFATLALPHLDAVYRAAVALAGRRADADDLVQTAYAKALERFDSFEPGTNCRAWLLRIVRNTWVDELRHRKHVGTPASIEAVEPSAPPPGPPEAPWPPSAAGAVGVLETFSDDQVLRALADLPEDQRLTLLLVDVEGLSQDEAADVLHVPPGTIKSRTSRARSALRDKLMAHAKDLGLLGRKP